MTTHVNICSCSFIFSVVFLENVFQHLSRWKWLGRIICKTCFCWKTLECLHSSFFIYKCKQEIIPFFPLLVRLYRWTITVVWALMPSWAWTFIMLEKKNQGNLIAGNPGEPRCEGQFCGITLLPIYTTTDNIKCYRYPLILPVAKLGQRGIKLVKKSQTQNCCVLLVWGFFTLLREHQSSFWKPCHCYS